MKRKTGLTVIGIILFSLTLFFTIPASATVVGCLLSGQQNLYLDTNGNGQQDAGDGYFTLEFDDVTNTFIVMGHGIDPDPNQGRAFLYNVVDNGDTIVFTEIAGPYNHPTYGNLTSAHTAADFLKITGKKDQDTDFNRIDMEWLNPGLKGAAGAQLHQGVLVDSNGDGFYDRVQATININNPNIPKSLVDVGISYITGPNGQRYIKIDQGVGNVRSADLTSVFDSPLVFLPIGNNGAITLTRADTGAELGRFTADASGYFGPGWNYDIVPTLQYWGFALMVLLILVTGIWAMRRLRLGENLPRP
jgi:hypothetical protein